MFEKERKPGRQKTKEIVAIRQLSFRVTEQEKKLIEEATELNGGNRSDFIRETILDYIRREGLIKNA